MSTPYREPGAVSDAHAKYPRIVRREADWRLIQITKGAFVIESRSVVADSMGVSAEQWSVVILLSEKDLKERASLGATSDFHARTVALWLCERLVEATS